MGKVTLPLYKQVLADLQHQIDSGKFKTDDLIPSENDLCKTYNTTRATVRNALNVLMNQGYITRQHGKGSIVSNRKKGLGILSISGVTAGLTDGNLKTKILNKPAIVNWPLDLFCEPELNDAKADVIYFSRIRSINDTPVLYEDTAISNKLLDFVSLDLANRSLFSILGEKYNLRVLGGEQQISAISATTTIAKLLKLEKGSPVLYVKRKLSTSNPEIHIYSSIFCNTEKYFLQDYF
ncbi:MAG TPA: GntR family transcriptional regulator [Pedobacter sp.]|jgi:GntR family transcriptional regulator/GntR family frlABCD operon transcriptional regulator